MNRCLLLIAALGVVTAPNVAAAERYELSLGTNARHLHSTTVDAISANNRHTMFAMSAGVQLDRDLLRTQLQLELGFEAGAIEGKTYQHMRSDTSLETLTAGARLRWPLASSLLGFGRAAVGLSRVTFELRDTSGTSAAIRDRGYAGIFELGGGLDYVLLGPTSKHKSGSLAVRLELGYTAASPVNLQAKPATPMEEGTIIIPTTPADLGSLNTSSWNFRLGLVARF